MSTYKKLGISFVFLLLIIAGIAVYFISRNKIENKIIVKNQTEVETPTLTFYLTPSNSLDNEIIKGEKFGETFNIPALETSTVQSSVPISEDANIVFEYQDAFGQTITEFVNDYIPYDSKNYEMELIIMQIT